uniref:Uncharacterized protein n=1 Tax=candidate division WOR-3 bacterium TaxID=2052148 RepID=A0A7C6A9W2_UNCW3
MRRGILFLIILAVLVIFAWQVVLKPKPAPKSTKKKTKADTTETKEVKKTKGRRVGKLKRQTAEERKAEKKRLRAERKRLREELRRRKREERLARKGIRKKGRGKSTRKGVSAYVLQAIIWFDVGPSYAMIDGRRYEVGDVVSGRRIVAINQDQIVIDYRGQQSVVRMGESLLPKSYLGTERRRRS